MTAVRLLAAALALTLAPGVRAAHPDTAGCKDPSLFTRIPGYWIYRCKDLDFDRFKFKVPEGKRAREQAVEGRLGQVIYKWDDTAGPRPGRPQILRNYQNAVKKLGGEVLFEDPGLTTLRVVKGDAETWAQVDEYGGSVTVHVLERQAMRQEVVANADALASDLAATGHASVYGILFDTGLAVVKPESEPTLAEIAKLLATDPALQLRVVGHTDAVGNLEDNLKLSQARAEAVRSVLGGKHGVAAARLTAHGVGPLAPVATNATDEGRAKNRRVELVKR